MAAPEIAQGMTTNLAPVYLDDARVQLQGDPRPQVSKIVTAGGKQLDGATRVVRLRDQSDEDGTPVRLEDVIDRAQGPQPVYLRCVDQAKARGLAADEEAGLGGGSVTRQEFAGGGHGAPDDAQSSIGNRARPQRPTSGGQAFGAARPGMAGQGAQGSAGDLPADKRAKSDFALGERSGTSNETYGAGDLQPGGRTGLSDRPARPDRPRRGPVDGTQEFQSGGRQGEGLEASYSDEGVGSTGRRQASTRSASGVATPEQGAQGGAIRDASTDSQGRQQGQASGSREGDGTVAEPSD